MFNKRSPKVQFVSTVHVVSNDHALKYSNILSNAHTSTGNRSADATSRKDDHFIFVWPELCSYIGTALKNTVVSKRIWTSLLMDNDGGILET